jgi:hypothetical protein
MNVEITQSEVQKIVETNQHYINEMIDAYVGTYIGDDIEFDSYPNGYKKIQTKVCNQKCISKSIQVKGCMIRVHVDVVVLNHVTEELVVWDAKKDASEFFEEIPVVNKFKNFDPKYRFDEETFEVKKTQEFYKIENVSLFLDFWYVLETQELELEDF